MSKVFVLEGKSYLLPDWCNWIAVDYSGAIWCFEFQPAPVSEGFWYDFGGLGKTSPVGKMPRQDYWGLMCYEVTR